MAEETEDIRIKLKSLFKKHNYDKSYNILSIVTHIIDGELSFYQAIRNVPQHIPITDKSYWKLITSSAGDYVDDEPDIPVEPIVEPDYLCFTAAKEGSTLRLIGEVRQDYGYHEDTFNLQFSYDKTHWENVQFIESNELVHGFLTYPSETFTFSNIGDKIYFKGNNINGTSYEDQRGTIYAFIFDGEYNTMRNDNIFYVSGDLQTIVNETGQDKEHGCFNGLFYSSRMSILSAPDLTATKIVLYKYNNLFFGQSLLEEPAIMYSSFTIEDLKNSNAFAGMYSYCTSLREPVYFNNITITNETDFDDFMYTFQQMYTKTNFEITDNNGIILKPFPNINTSILQNISNHNSFELACILGNIEGFVCVTIIMVINNVFHMQLSPGEFIEEVGNYIYWNVWENQELITLSASAANTTPTKWQESIDGTNWTDIPDSNHQTITISNPNVTTYYRVLVN